MREADVVVVNVSTVVKVSEGMIHTVSSSIPRMCASAHRWIPLIEYAVVHDFAGGCSSAVISICIHNTSTFCVT